MVILLLKHLNIVTTGRLFFLLQLLTFQFCVLSKSCAVSLLQSIIHIALYDKKHLQIIFAWSIIIRSLGSLFSYIVFQENTWILFQIFAFFINTMHWNVDSSNVFLIYVTGVTYTVFLKPCLISGIVLLW